MSDALEDMVQRHNRAIEAITGCTDKAEVAARIKKLEQINEELAELVGDLEDEVDSLKEVCRHYGWNPDTQTSCRSEVE